MADIEFANKGAFFLFLVFIPAIIWYVVKLNDRNAKVRISSDTAILAFSSSLKNYLVHAPFVMRLLGISALVVAMARPQSSSSWQDVTTEGIDIVIAMDISSSMLAEDLKPNRLEASKNVAIEFVNSRINDRIGLVTYAGESFTQCPLTTDHDVLVNMFSGIKNGMIEDGTAIGSGLATAVNRLKDSEAKSKVIILLTDGSNNKGSIPPITAAEIAQTFGIRVYTIGVGTNGTAPFPMRNPFGGIVYQDIEVKIDEAPLKEIAEVTGGTYYRATNNKSLREIYDKIDALEKSKINVTEFNRRSEEFWPWVLLAFILFSFEYLLKLTYLRSAV